MKRRKLKVTKKMRLALIGSNALLNGSGGWIRTSDQLINSQLRYHCATPERGENAEYCTILNAPVQVGISSFFILSCNAVNP